ncbi:Hsp20/alpha crystallin family protein [Candidatus Falkowbacteria bacterium]|uniref:Molecular chaperone n=1 Tax=Candidatus Falkowbacteria bacterium CG10_big_fil_rev_8_21_14_0_10_37_18 TaxID=1974562 RepID=A0A2H0V950_9BACT|nr:Hsp20/alpha crystallin family protein [Candidatus Falkowbacteria bacterium]NCQ12750.1 Hsp20/alpha crystallin family protein [Candidatus Falkowbacteria bacterium]PIR95618.1 MAG: molecular chaperone [Candidatus Falkowbacteria bacterium CG10_big_fil_rev_8_21_14_0_10_37_18]
MSLIKWTPFFPEFEDMDKNFESMLPSVRGNQFGFTPAVDMYEDKDNVVVETQLGGIDPDKVDISIENNILTLKGESEKKSEVEEKNYYRKEIRRGSFYRSIPLPTKVDGDKASAVSEGGLLKISIPKAAEVKPRTIKIQTKK